MGDAYLILLHSKPTHQMSDCSCCKIHQTHVMYCRSMVQHYQSLDMGFAFRFGCTIPDFAFPQLLPHIKLAEIQYLFTRINYQKTVDSTDQ